MPLDADGYKTLIIAQVGDDAGGTLAAQIGVLWTANDSAPDLATQFLYAKRDAIDVMLAKVRSGVDYTAQNGTRVNLDQLFKHLVQMREDVTAQIAVASAQSAASGGGAVGQLTTTAPVSAPSGCAPDANDRRYRGDPYRRRWPR